ncbi:O-antigen ligase family protein [Elizabethkingia meningoseptica]|uniref:O-antigen ligase family protein n=1 Tax=Elizabethkingia meningoseptica TaxID=238 RepID=UPI0023B02E10|nr:O-antigen ligase family protein [Elizabethkingia meningoseptica]MDE5438579.1 O-antigen ligase family protein [Elizabethkingia meningoseptica]MDE5507650.1 O-antigen ligase family protein [Elizabethkingia meningoseptica]MDE5516500.1 O-antigen ligase family protein [Elizabethkingia meningoseptica]MDE5526745.1 O-antigen ligase family protein [Elizabethkingia meningoseptica]MDE5530751.1 O-antigen ligase family protein [Elizabethkingia meningoseptica]
MFASLAIFLISLGGVGGSFQPTRLLILIAGLFSGIRKRVKKNVLGMTPLIRKGLIIYIIWILYGLLTLFWAPDPLLGLNSEIIVMGIGMSSLLFFPYYYENKIFTVNTLCQLWAWSCIATLPIAIYEIFTFQHFFYEDEERVLGGLGLNVPFAATFFGNYNGYSTILCFYYPFLLISFMNEKRKLYKIIFGTAIFLSIIIVMINTSRGALITFAIITLFAMKVNIKRIAISFSSLIILYFMLPSGIKNTIDTVFKYRFGGGGGLKDDSRSGLLNAGIDFLINSYGFGIGAGGFEIEMEKSKYYSGMVNPHNIFIEILSQYGLIIFILFVYWLFLLCLSIWKNKILTKDIRKILIGTILCFPIIGAINSAALGYTYWWVFLTTLAMIASIKPKLNINDKSF